MSQQQSQTVTLNVWAAPQGEADISEPTPERQVQLRADYDANIAAGKPPYEDVWILTLGELGWVLRERDWSVASPPLKGKQSPDLRGAKLGVVNLSRVELTRADLSRTFLVSANLSGASLSFANLSGANLDGANLSTTVLAAANLSGASLSFANLSGTNLLSANLSGANLTGARMDAATSLSRSTLDDRTMVMNVMWNGAQLDGSIAWPKSLGDEQQIKEAQNRRDYIRIYRNVARAYRGLSIALRSQGVLIPASNYRLREQVLERKVRLLEGSLLGWVFSWLLNLVAGYGERPVRSFFAYLLVLFGFAGAYFALGSGGLASVGLGAHDAITSPLSALVFSVTSFHGRGFFPGGLALDDPLTVLAAAEAVIGLFIEITFIATFTQRFFGGR
jgi:hypothetical protein